MKYPRIQSIDEREGLKVGDALLFCFYMRYPNGRIAPAAVRALEHLRQRIQPYTFERYDVGEGEAVPFDEPSWTRILERLLSPGPEQSAFLCLEAEIDATDDIYVSYRGLKSVQHPWPERKHDVSVLYIRLPTRYLEERGSEQVRALALGLAAELPFNSGYVDFSLCASPWNFGEALPLIYPRHPGIHLTSTKARLRMDTWVEGVHWMNFLGAPVLDQLGGAAGLRQALPGIPIEELGADRVLITLGEHPDPGDLQTGHTLPRYRALARVLAPYLHRWPELDSQVATEAMRQWERRFLDEPEPGPT